MSSLPTFKQSTLFEYRLAESERVMAKHPKCRPVIVEPYGKTSVYIEKTKYLVCEDFTIGQFLYVLRKKLHLPPEKALFLFVEGALVPSSAYIKVVYAYKKDNDGFLYMHYGFENTFGIISNPLKESSI